MSDVYDFDVIVAGAGPVGLSLTIDLGRRGVKVLLLEAAPEPAPWPKMDRSNARTMEIYRRLGLVDRIRALGYPDDNPMNVLLVRSLAQPPIAVLEYPSVAERRAEVKACRDGSLPLEPYHLVSQNAIEPLLRKVAQDETANTGVMYDRELVDFTDHGEGVEVTARDGNGKKYRFSCRYLVGCDGARSTVRRRLGVDLKGTSAPADRRQVIFWSEDLYERMTVPRGRHFTFPDGSSFVAQGNRKQFTFHTPLPETTDFEAELRRRIGFDCDLRIDHVTGWKAHLLIADKYRVGNVLMAGDAVHLVIPTGGLGMNTGVGDAIDLGWKLAGTVQGWGGPGLLDGYEQERRPIAQRNIEASGWAFDGSLLWQQQVTPEIEQDGAAGDAARKKLAGAYTRYHARMHGMVGAEAGYTYAGSPLVAAEPGNQAHWPISSIEPHARPGVRLPHMWVSDGRPIQDVLGYDYTLLKLDRDFDTADLIRAFADVGAPLDLIYLDEPEMREVYNAGAVLVRPDLHVVWRGNAPPADAQAIAQIATGNGPAFRR